MTYRISIFLFSFFIFWEISVNLFYLPKYILPPPTDIFLAMYNNKSTIIYHTYITFVEVFLGLTIGFILGVATAIQIAFSSFSRVFLRPFLVFSQAIPVFALAPLLTLWFGYGLTSKVIMAILIIYFPITSNFLDGLTSTPKGYLDLAHLMGGKKHLIMLKIKVPYAIPYLGSGLKLAAVYAPIGATIGEWVGSSEGLGYLMLLANGRVKTDLMFASMMILCLLSLFLYYSVSFMTKKLKIFNP